MQKRLFHHPSAFKINGRNLPQGTVNHTIYNNRIESITECENDDYSATVSSITRYEGYIEYSVKITPKRDFKSDNVLLDFYVRNDCSSLFHGLGHRASKAENLSFKWDNQKQQDSIFIGAVNCGMRLKLKAENYIRPLINIFYKNLPLRTPVETWDNYGRGGITVHRQQDYVQISVYTGEFEFKKNET